MDKVHLRCGHAKWHMQLRTYEWRLTTASRFCFIDSIYDLRLWLYGCDEHRRGNSLRRVDFSGSFLGRFLLRSRPLGLATVGLAIACTWSLLWARISHLTFYGQTPDIHFFSDSAKLWHLFFVFIFGALLVNQSQERLKKLSYVWIASSLISALLGIVQHHIPLIHPQALPNPGLRPGMFGLYHATGFSGFHLSYVAILSFPTFVALSFLQNSYKTRQNFYFWLSACTALTFANYFAFSKGNWIAVPIVFFIFALVEMRGKLFWISNAIALGALSAMVTSPQFQARFEPKILIYGTLRDRLELWSANLEMIKQHFLFGVGWHHNSDLSKAFYNAIGNSSAFQSHAHNNLADQLATTGILGLAFFVYWNWIIIKRSFELSRNERVPTHWKLFFRGLFYGWIGLHLNGLTQTNFWDAKVLHQLTWVAAFTMMWPISKKVLTSEAKNSNTTK